MADDAIEVLLEEGRTFPPPDEFKQSGNLNDPGVWERADRDPEGFWAEQAQQLDWFKTWDKVLEWDCPWAKWFIGGKLNVSYNCLDRHVKTARKNKAAIIWEGEPGDERVLTYRDVWREVNKFANVLKGLGVQKGDRVALYLGMVPELLIAMHACNRIGAVHSVVFGGFSAESLSDRINDASAKVLVTGDGGYRRGGIVPLKKNADEAVESCPSIENVVVVERVGSESGAVLKEGRDHWWHELMADAPLWCEPEQMDSEDMLFSLYTSGTTGKPKGIVHTTAGYLLGVYLANKWVFDMKEDDVFWCAADIGWVTGHTHIVYGPMANGVTQVMYEGTPDWPDKDRLWRMVEKYGVTIFHTAPTAIRTFMRWGTEFPAAHDLSSLRLLGSVGEPINPEAWMWYHEHIGSRKCPIMDTWWQTETGHPLITPFPAVTTLKPASATKPFPGVEADIVDEQGNSVPLGGGGYLVLKRPWPAMLRTVFNDPDRYVETYWSRFPGMYFAGDGAKRDTDGYFWLLGRVDDVMNVSGHRISTMEVESALVDHQAVAEAAVIGKQHEVKGQGICAFVSLIAGVDNTPELVQELRAHVAKKIGAIARPDELYYAAELPKTRSGKIMRRLLRDIADGKALGDTTTLADPAVVAQLKEQYEDE
ncbi:MAG: acetate--CoA ligase [Deltaproteobacteria bacterium]|nr:acetate--CoA ligase [Deltaproteobacteria bacterium]